MQLKAGKFSCLLLCFKASKNQTTSSLLFLPPCLPPGGSLTPAAPAAGAAQTHVSERWSVKGVSADRLPAKEHRVSGSLVPINKQNMTFDFCTVTKGHLSHISTSHPDESLLKLTMTLSFKGPKFTSRNCGVVQGVNRV